MVDCLIVAFPGCDLYRCDGFGIKFDGLEFSVLNGGISPVHFRTVVYFVVMYFLRSVSHLMSKIGRRDW